MGPAVAHCVRSGRHQAYPLHPEPAIRFRCRRGPLHPEDPFMLTVPTSWQKKEAEEAEKVEDEEEGVAPLLKSRV